MNHKWTNDSKHCETTEIEWITVKTFPSQNVPKLVKAHNLGCLNEIVLDKKIFFYHDSILLFQ